MPYQRRMSMRERLQHRIEERRNTAREALRAEFGPPWWINPGAMMRSGLPKNWKALDTSEFNYAKAEERIVAVLGDTHWGQLKDGANAKENT